MRIDIACFTAQGHELGERLRRELQSRGEVVLLDRCGGDGVPVREWTQEHFPRSDALIFVGAVGIAVRAIAPELVSKAVDPAVVVVDDAGTFSIALLSGHIGGANALARQVAEILQATSVVTTSTDVNRVFAFDDWARRSGLIVQNPERIKSVSSRLLAGKTVTLQSGFPVRGALPLGVALAEADGDVVVDILQPARADALHLVPPVTILGVGCRKGTDVETIENAFTTVCAASGVSPLSIDKVCSIDLKEREPGLLDFCQRRGLRFETFPAERLAAVEGEFGASSFVKTVAGVDNVCERSAVAGSGGRLLVGKTVAHGVTMALAVGEYVVDFSAGEKDDA